MKEIITKYLENRASETDQHSLLKWIRSGKNLKEFRSVEKSWGDSLSTFGDDESENKRLLKFQAFMLNKEHHKTVKLHRILQMTKYAAIFILPIMVYASVRMLNTPTVYDSLVWNEITTPAGLRSAFVLPDGTKVQLNGGTSLKYPTRFAEGERAVELKGEAYFEVVSDKSNPFVVDLGEMSVVAVGTAFNISAYAGDEELVTSLVEGKVNIVKNTENGHTELSTLKPNQQAIYDVNNGEVEQKSGDLNKYLAWRDDKIIFDNDSLPDVIKRIERWYNVEFILPDNMSKDYAFTGVFQGEPLSQILEILEVSTPIKFIMQQMPTDTTIQQKKKIKLEFKES
ncbi:MAG: DUF4974 domain-containing protein [Carboxylicivirga sp.]|jgi:ferric-dicitrate binding protein FerR (iron transport regulator)|nr:DUF4974 domain-containing protein [Carboxylicivirga sp.]